MLNNPLQYFKRPVSGMDRTMISAMVCGMLIAGTSVATTAGKCYTNVHTKAQFSDVSINAFLLEYGCRLVKLCHYLISTFEVCNVILNDLNSLTK